MTALDLPAEVVAAVQLRSHGLCEIGYRGCGRRAWLHALDDPSGPVAADNLVLCCRPCFDRFEAERGRRAS